MKFILNFNLALSFLFLTHQCAFAGNGDAPADKNSAVPGINVKNMDVSIPPGKDFYTYVNGNWIKNNPVPESESRWSSFNEVKKNNQELLRKLLSGFSDGTASEVKGQPDYVASNRKLMGTLYLSGMDEKAVDESGMTAIKSLLEVIDQFNEYESLNKVLLRLMQNGVAPLFRLDAEADLKNSSMVALYVGQGGLSMPDRDYYLNKSDKMVTIRAAYVNHVSKMLQLSGIDQGTADENAKTILLMETELADVSLSRTDLRDPYKTYNVEMVDQLTQKIPQLEWNGFLNDLGAHDIQTVVLDNPGFYQFLGKMIPNYTVEEWKMFLRWKLIRDTAPYLSNAFRKESFAFNETTLKGVTEMEERWKFVQETVDNLMGDALGQMYCEYAYDNNAEKKMVEMIGNIKTAFKDRLASLSWMSKETRKYAVMKLDSMVWKIGKPEKWLDYTSVDLNGSFCENVIKLNAFEFNRKMNKVGKPVDRKEWGMSTPTVNAYYNPSLNEIVFPAGILQPPFFNKDADAAVNFGAIGAVIGHEIIHGFDDQGSKFDYKGNLHNWWTSTDSSNFATIADKIVKQYEQYTMNGDQHLNGRLTLGENIADIGGMAVSYQAYKYYLKSKPAPAPIDGLTGDQRFFISFGQVWRNNIRPEEAARRILTDPHSPGKYRCIGVVSNMEPFYAAFGVKETEPMYRGADVRVAIW
ncbi:MAG TPA: M13 family metallopeptidase [Bacteroidia bacterium]|nr:M13 family metallopeptidase [Bacteroidia bacterium]